MGLINNQTYTGKQAQDFYSAAFLSAETIKNIAIIPNIKNSLKLNKVTVAGLVQADNCSFSDGGTTTLATNTLTVCNAKINMEWCTNDFEAMWMSEGLKAGSNNNEVPSDFQTYVLNQVGLYTGQYLEQKIWTGNTSTSPADICNGFYVNLAADGTVVTQTAATLSASNIIAELIKVYDKIPATVINSPKMRIFMGVAAAKFYKQAQAAVATGSGTYYIGDKAMDFLGIPVVICPGMSANHMVAAEYDNLVMGTDLLGDIGDVQIIDRSLTEGTPNVRFVGRFKFGVQHRVGAEIVYYS